MRPRVLLSAGVLLLVALLAGCADDPRFDRMTAYLGDVGRGVLYDREPSFDNVSYWDGDGVQGSPKIVIRLDHQRAYFYKGGQLVGVSAISTGREGFNTVRGNFKIIEKDIDHVSSRFGDYVDANGNVIQKDIDTTKDRKPPGARYDGARMPYFMRIVGGTGMHEGFLPGYPASHGCIRMPGFMAEAFYRNAPLGTPVTVTD
jgi:L,D-transpeptidase catalytic domain